MAAMQGPQYTIIPEPPQVASCETEPGDAHNNVSELSSIAKTDGHGSISFELVSVFALLMPRQKSRAGGRVRKYVSDFRAKRSKRSFDIPPLEVNQCPGNNEINSRRETERRWCKNRLLGAKRWCKPNLPRRLLLCRAFLPPTPGEMANPPRAYILQKPVRNTH